MANESLRGVLIGCGYASGFQLEAWRRIAGVEIVAVSSRNAESALRRAAEFEIPGVYTDYHEMLDNEKFDFVDISTPPVVHLEMIREAAQRGADVLCQKPIADSMAELREMIALCEEAGVRLMVNENGRFQPWFRKIKQILDSGILGAPFFSNFSYPARMTLPTLDAGDQTFLFSRMPRLVTYELGVHALDTLRYLFGEPASLYALMNKIGKDVRGEDVATLMLRFAALQAIVELSWASLPARDYGNAEASWGECRIDAEKGTLLLERNGLLRLIKDDETEDIQFSQEGELLGYVGAQQHFVDCLVSGEPFETSGTETLKTMELVFGSYLSATENKVYCVEEDISRLA